MKIFKLIRMLLILSGLSSCATTTIKNQEVCDVIIFASTELCQCRWVSSKTLEAITDPIDYPLKHCHGFTGVRTKTLYKDLLAPAKDYVRECEDLRDQWEDNYN